MKQIQLIIKPFKLDEVREALEKEKVQRMTLIDVKHRGTQHGMVNQYRGTQYIEDIREVKVEVVAEDDEAEQIASTIVTTLRTGALCDGEITIVPMEKIVCVRIGKL